MLVIPLASGSAGNCYFFESGSTRLLVDAGLGPRETARRLAASGRSLEEVQAIVLTHEHHDHIHGAAKIARKFGIPIHLTRGTLDACRIDPFETPVVIFENNTAFRIGDIEVHARRTIHDAADPACFVLQGVDGARAGIASDLGYADGPVVQHLSDCDTLLFESNHDLDMLRSGTYPWSLKRRIMSNHGHLSNDDAMNAVRRMLGPTTRTLCLIHLSEKNNHASIVASMATSLLDALGAKIELRIAEQRAPGEPIEVARRAVVPPPVPVRSGGRNAGQMALF